MEDGDGSGEYFEFLQLLVAVDGGILKIGLLEECGCFFDACAFLEECGFAVDFFYLFWFECLLGF